jgi:hypothetical protein
MAEETASVLRGLDGIEPDMDIPDPTVTRTQPGKSIPPDLTLCLEALTCFFCERYICHSTHAL